MAINTGEFGATTTGSPTNEMQMTQPEVLTDNVAYKQRLRALPEVQNLTNEIDITNVNSILAFGQKPSEGISQLQICYCLRCNALILKKPLVC